MSDRVSDWQDKPAWPQLVAIAFGGAARIAIRFGLSADQASRLMMSAWYVVQNLKEEDQCSQITTGDSAASYLSKAGRASAEDL